MSLKHPECRDKLDSNPNMAHMLAWVCKNEKAYRMSRDNIYQHPKAPVPPFEFDAQVARVFDDMIQRSIPFYPEILRQQVRLIQQHYRAGTRIYDLGCSNGNLGLALCRQMGPTPFKMIAVDNSAPMLDLYQERLGSVPAGERIRLHNQDIRMVALETSSVVVLNFTLQFLDLGERDALMQRIRQSLIPGGVLLFCEKITHDQKPMADLQQTFYHTFKRENGYSDLEISQKREALEKVLIPETLAQHLTRLHRVGFKTMDVWFKWFNFAALVVLK
jgi:tRNA (cmo5U34)-methyltransferase